MASHQGRKARPPRCSNLEAMLKQSECCHSADSRIKSNGFRGATDEVEPVVVQGGVSRGHESRIGEEVCYAPFPQWCQAMGHWAMVRRSGNQTPQENTVNSLLETNGKRRKIVFQIDYSVDKRNKTQTLGFRYARFHGKWDRA